MFQGVERKFEMPVGIVPKVKIKDKQPNLSQSSLMI